MVVFVVASVGRGVNWNGLRVVVVVGGFVVVVDFLVVGRGPLVGTVGTSGVVVVLGGGLGVVNVASGLKPGGRSPDRSSRITGTAGETRKPSINTPELEGGGVGVVCSSSGMLAAWWGKRSKGLAWVAGIPPGHGHAGCDALEGDVLVHQTTVSYCVSLRMGDDQ